MNPWKRRFLLETIMFRFHLNFRGVSQMVVWWRFIMVFLCSSLFGEDPHFDDHIFQMGWFNHQPEFFIRLFQTKKTKPPKRWIICWEKVKELTFEDNHPLNSNGWFNTYKQVGKPVFSFDYSMYWLKQISEFHNLEHRFSVSENKNGQLYDLFSDPIVSMYGIFGHIYHKNQPIVCEYTIHGSCGD